MLAHHQQRIRPFQLRHRGTHGLEQIADRFQVVVDAMRNDLGVGLGIELVAAPLEVGAQLVVVLDDAVVHDGQAIARDVRVRVALARHPVGGPAGVRDADLAVSGTVRQGVIELAHLADRAQPGEVARAVQDGDAGRVVAAIFEPSQSLHEDGNHVPLGDRSYDSTHIRPSILQRRNGGSPGLGSLPETPGKR
jgi:hypothetical protein